MNNIDRREFISNACRFCTIVFIGSSILNEESCSVYEIIFHKKSEDGIVKVPLSDFESRNSFLIKTDEVREKILVIKKSENDFIALRMKCTHMGFELVQKENLLVCNAHGSQFDLDGNVIHAPARQPLKAYPITIKKSELIIHLKEE